MTGGEKSQGQSERLHMRISPSELSAIDDWRFANRVSSRSEAVRRLCQLGAALDPWVRASPEIYLRVHQAQEAIAATVEALRASANAEIACDPAGLPAAAAQLDDARYELLAHIEGMNRVLEALASGETLDGGIEEAKKIATGTAESKAAFGGIASLSHAMRAKMETKK